MRKLSSPHIGWHVIFGQVVTKLDFVIGVNCISGQLELIKKKNKLMTSSTLTGYRLCRDLKATLKT